MFVLIAATEEMDNSIVTERLSQLGFRVYSGAEIQKLSVKEITNPQLFDYLSFPTVGGLYDPALGKSCGLKCTCIDCECKVWTDVLNILFGMVMQLLL